MFVKVLLYSRVTIQLPTNKVAGTYPLCYFVARLREKWRKNCLISKIDAYLVDLPILQVTISIDRDRRLRPTIGPVGRGLLAPILVA